MGELRAVLSTLFLPVIAYMSTPPFGNLEAAERSMLLMRGICGALWGMAASLRGAGTPPPATPGQVGILWRLLSLTPDFIDAHQQNER